MRQFLASLTVLALVWAGSAGSAVAANVAILMPGSAGIAPGDFLVRNQNRFEQVGIRTIMTTSPATAAAAVAAEAAQGRKTVIVGMSKGSVDAAEAISAGERAISLASARPNATLQPYLQHQLAKIHIAAGERAKALDVLERLLRGPYYVSPQWLRIDPTFAPLRGDQRFERLASSQPVVFTR